MTQLKVPKYPCLKKIGGWGCWSEQAPLIHSHVKGLVPSYSEQNIIYYWGKKWERERGNIIECFEKMTCHGAPDL